LGDIGQNPNGPAGGKINGGGKGGRVTVTGQSPLHGKKKKKTPRKGSRDPKKPKKFGGPWAGAPPGGTEKKTKNRVYKSAMGGDGGLVRFMGARARGHQLGKEKSKFQTGPKKFRHQVRKPAIKIDKKVFLGGPRCRTPPAGGRKGAIGRWFLGGAGSAFNGKLGATGGKGSG